MTIRKKTFLIITTVLAALIACAIWITCTIIVRRADDTDRQRIDRSTSRAFIILSQMIADLERAAMDYAAWDESCDFVTNRNERFIRVNLDDSALAQNRFAFMVFLDPHGNVVFGKGCDLETATDAPAPAALLNNPAADNPLLRRGSDRPLNGVLILPEGPFLVSACPILTSDSEGPSHGTLIAGRPLDKIALDILAQLTQLDPVVTSVSSPEIPAVVRTYLLASTNDNRIASMVVDSRTIAGYGLVRDIFNQPALFLRVSGTRDHFSQALTDLLILSLFLIGIGAAAVAVSISLIDRLVLARTTRLHSFVNQVGTTGDLSQRLTLKGNDELSHLGSAFNRMLDALQQDIVERKHTQLNLQESEEMFRSIFEGSPLGMATCDPDGRFLRVNKSFCNMIGYTEVELLPMTYKDITPPDIVAADAAAVQKVLRGELPVYRTEKQYVRKGGDRVWGRVTVSAVRDRQDEFVYLLAMIEDIDEQKKAAEALKQQENLLRNVIDVHPGFVFVKDRESRFLLANRTLCNVYGTTVNDIIGKTDADFNSSKEEVEHFHSDDVEVIDTKEPKHVPMERITAADGSVRWLTTFKLPLLAADGSCNSLLGITIDITDLKRAEEALIETEGKYKAVIETTSTGYVMLDTQGRVLEANDRYVQLTGHTTFSEIRGRCVMEWTAPEDRDRNARELMRCIEQGPLVNMEIKYIDAGGKITPIEINATHVETREGWRTVALCRDISERKRHEEDQRLLERQMEQSQKLESLGVLAGGIAHDFNNLLMAVLGNADMALSDLPTNSPTRDTIQEIIKGARRAADLCKQMLAYSGKSQFVVEPQELTAIVREMTHMLEVSVSKKAILRYNFADNLPAVNADATQLRQVIMNLILNASEAIGEKSGVIAVTTGAMECDTAYLRECFLGENLTPGLYVYLEVADTGCGMDPKTIQRVFEPFFSTKFTGRGLGLTAVFGIVRGHRGALRVESEIGRGTRFRFLLPASELGAVRKDSDPEPEEWKGSGTVLVVDDEETVRALGKRMIERSGFTALTATDGLHAVDVFRKNADKIVCVVLDMTMPHMDGVETFHELKKIRDDVVVILSSGYDEQEVSRRFAGAGIAGFVEKPYTRATLCNAIRRVLDSSTGKR